METSTQSEELGSQADAAEELHADKAESTNESENDSKYSSSLVEYLKKTVKILELTIQDLRMDLAQQRQANLSQTKLLESLQQMLAQRDERRNEKGKGKGVELFQRKDLDDSLIQEINVGLVGNRASASGSNQVPTQESRQSQEEEQILRRVALAKSIPRNYASVAAAPAQAPRPSSRKLTSKDTKLINRALAPKTTPVEFDRVSFRVQSGIFSKYKAGDRFFIARMLLKQLGLGGGPDSRRKYFDLSLIGNSVIEIYVPRPELVQVQKILRDHNLSVIEEGPLFSPDFGTASSEKIRDAVVSRLSGLYRRASLMRLKECILRDLPEELKQAIREKAIPREAVAAAILAHASASLTESTDIQMSEPLGAGSQ
jgi:hypothetical protein